MKKNTILPIMIIIVAFCIFGICTYVLTGQIQHPGLNEKVTTNKEGIKGINYGGWEPLLNFCPKCGKFSLSTYCNRCGTKQDKYYYKICCPVCDPDFLYSGDYCWNCGKKLVWRKVKRIRIGD